MKNNVSILFLISVLTFTPMTASALSLEFVHQSNYSEYYDEAGLFSGFWHGLIAPWSLFVRLLSPLGAPFDNLGIYAYANTGWFYDLGFLLGIFLSLPIGWLAAVVAFIALLI